MEEIMEGQNLEFKTEWRDDVLKTVCAFANADGGTIYIGVDDKGRSIALKNTKKLLEDIPNKIKDILGIVADVKSVKKMGNPVIKITIKKYTAPISYKGAFYIRSGSTTSELKGTELSRFLLSRAGTTWDNIVEPRTSFDDISVKTIRHFQQLAKTRFPFIAREKNIKLILQKLNLTEKGKLKRAAILLFGKNPRKYFTSAFIQVGRFVTESDVISTDVIEGNLFAQVDKTIELLWVKYLQNRFYYEGIYRKEDLEIPEEALREAIINALVHRDYIGSHTQLKVYNDYLTLWNEGGLLGGLTPSMLKRNHPSRLRNELIADVFFKAGLIEAWGRGTLKIIGNCRKKGLPEPEFSELANGFCVTFHKAKGTKQPVAEAVEKTVEKTVEKILESIKNNPTVTTKQLEKITGLTRRGVEWNIANLKKKGIIKRIGPARGGHWRVYGKD